MLCAKSLKSNGETVKSNLFELTKNGALTTSEIKDEDDLNKVVTSILSADAALF